MGEKNQAPTPRKPQSYPPINALGLFPEMHDFDVEWDEEIRAPKDEEKPPKDPAAR